MDVARRRIEERGDLFRPVLEGAQSLAAAMTTLAG
jgi:hypothetical protein